VTATCRFGDRTALKSISEEMESGRPPLISRGIQTVPITNCAVIHGTHVEDAWVAGQQRAADRWKGLAR